MDCYYRTELQTSDAIWKAGDVIRLVDFDAAWMDALILGFNDDGYALLSRPYAYVSSAGTTGPVILLGAERMEMYKIGKNTKRVGDNYRT